MKAPRICPRCDTEWELDVRHTRSLVLKRSPCPDCRIEHRNRRQRVRPYDLPLVIPGEWVTQGRCSTTDPEAWWPDSKTDPYRTTTALAVCESCPVKAQCLQWALDNKEYEGVWGGTTPDQRAQMLRERAS